MLKKLQDHIVQNFPFLMEKKLLIAVSGGLDSMVLLYLFHKLEYKIGVAHCNFQLRGLESLEDQKFVRGIANMYQIPVFIEQFETEKVATKHKLSTQVAARDLRYNWFYDLLESENYDFVLTAHHADDNLESFIINLSRGTGIDGLVGIPQQNNKVIRPLLIFSRYEIEDFANENNIRWREDSSNESDKYLRNKIRHHLIPILKDINPQFLEAFQKTQNYLKESQSMAETSVNLAYNSVAKMVGKELYIDINKLEQLPSYQSYLYYWLKDYGFKAWQDIYNLANGQTGKHVVSPEYILFKNRNFLVLAPINLEPKNQEYIIDDTDENVNFPLKLQFSKVNDIFDGGKTTIFVDANKLSFPLVIKLWNEGDNFQPFGMKGKSKLLSKFFKDEKLSLTEKQNIWILCSDNQIVWIIGMRQDERFKVEKTTINKLKISIEE